jgi:hypothetical protein
MPEITITIEEYKELLEQKVASDTFKNLLGCKRIQKVGIYADEVAFLCKLFGIGADNE